MLMNIMEQIQGDLKTAMKARDALKVSTLRQVMGLVQTEQKNGKGEHQLSETEVLKLLAKEVKKREESAEIYDKAKRPELAERERSENEIIRAYLPLELTETALEALVDSTIEEVGAKSLKEMGLVMKALTPKIAGRADGKTVSAMVRAKLG